MDNTGTGEQYKREKKAKTLHGVSP